MSGPFDEQSIVMDMETGRAERYLQFDRNGVDDDGWLHRVDEFDEELDLAAVVDQYSLPESDTDNVTIVEVPAGEMLQLGTIAALCGRSGGGDLAILALRETVPDEWILDETTLSARLE